VRSRWPTLVGVAVVAGAVGFVFGASRTGRGVGEHALRSTVAAVAERVPLSTRERVLLEHPEILHALMRGGSFGGEYSKAIAQGMFSRDPEAIEDARSLLKLQEVAPRTWLIRLPIVNAVLFETDAGLVLVDAGMAPAGPALVEALRRVSDRPLHTVIYTHGHVDHAYGSWALIEAGMRPEIVAQENLPARFERYLRLRGSIARYMDQPLETLPASREDLVWPTRTFRDRLELEIGGERFVLVHHRGETDDQLYVWVPGRRALASADYYQGFLPNAGNGKRVQRHPEEWAAALREMAELSPQVLLPAHGEASTDPAVIRENLLAHAEALQYIVDRTIEGLNAGLRQDQVYRSIALPERLARHPSLRVQYVTPQDISKMVIRQYVGWWDDIPSHWSPVDREVEAAELVRLAGGAAAWTARARELAESDIALASHLADWVFLAAPDDPDVQDLVIEVYAKRIAAPESNTQEMLTYLGAMTAARERQLAR